MNLRFRRATLSIFILLISFWVLPLANAQNLPQNLQLNKTLEREISRQEKHNFQINLSENEYAVVSVEQRGIDVIIRLFDTDQKPFAQSDSSLITEGREEIKFVASIAGAYRLEVEAKPLSSATGLYAVTILEERESTAVERLLEESRKLHNESIELYGAGNYAESLKLANQALGIREKESPESLETAVSLAHLGLVVYETGDYEKSISLLHRSLKIREKVLGYFHQDVARTFHNLARSQSSIGDYVEAIENYKKAVEIREKVLGKESADLATTLNNLGLAFLNLGDFDQAEQMIRRSLTIKEKTLAPNNPSLAVSLSALAGVLSAKGDDDRVLELYQQALSIREKGLKPGHPDIARSLESLANAYLDKGDYKQSEANYLRALDILQKAFGEEHYRIARVLGSLAILYQTQGNFAKAEPLFEQTSVMMEKNVGKLHTDFASAIYNQARFYTDKGDYERAEPLYQQSIAIAEKIFGSQHPDLISYLNGLARNYQSQGNAAQAVKVWTKAHRISEQNTRQILFINSERQKLLYLTSLSAETNQYISAHLIFAPNSPEALDLALTTIFERKGRVSDAMAFDLAVLRRRFDQNDRNLLDKLKNVTSQLSQKILNGVQNSSIEIHQRQINDLAAEKEMLEIEMSRKNAEFRSQIQPITISAIQSAIPLNAALIEFSLYRPFNPKAGGEKAYDELRYLVYVIRRDGKIQWKDLGAAKEIDKHIEVFRKSLADPNRKDFQQYARLLDEKIMLPIRAMVGNASQLLISPDGNLNLMPFETLLDEKKHYLIEKYSLTYLTNGRDLLRMQSAVENKNQPLVIANPSFGMPDSTQMVNIAKRQSITVTRNLSDTYFAPLSGTIEEARSIQTLFPGVEVLTEKNATETKLKQIIAPKILHIATHGFFLEDDDKKNRNANPLLRSGLALAGANERKGEKDDGILTAMEASGLNLWGTKLVVLSACDTGLGEVKNGEGVYGLRRAFVLAGTETLVMSLWSVSDLVTRELMTGYYKNLKAGIGRGESLRQVQLEMLKKPNRRHPFYWASFIQSGDWTGLENKK